MKTLNVIVNLFEVWKFGSSDPIKIHYRGNKTLRLKEKHTHTHKLLILCSTEERKSYRFLMT